MGENNDTERVKVNLNIQGKKSFITNLSLFFGGLSQFTKGLQVKKTPCICTTDNIFMKKWKNTLRNTEMTSVKKKDKAICSELHKKSVTHVFRQFSQNTHLTKFSTIFSISLKFVIFSSFLLRKKINYLISELQISLKYPNNTNYKIYPQSYSHYRTIIQ